jgi:hypothetical protein
MPSSSPPVNIPRPIIFLASIAIAFHLIAIVANVLGAPSGPWPSQEGDSGFTPPPQFAQGLNSAFGSQYLNSLHMANNYHFVTNRPTLPEPRLEIQVKSNQGGESKTIRLPDPDANFWVRHRQSILAAGLGNDIPVPPPQGEQLAAPGKQVRMVSIWEQSERGLKIRPTPEHLVPRDRPVIRPSELALLLARAYGRYVCRTQNASSAVVFRHWRDPIPPGVLSMPDLPQQLTEEFIADFGEFQP